MLWIMLRDGQTLVNLAQCTSIQLKQLSNESEVIAQPGDIIIFSGKHHHCESIYREIARALKPGKINADPNDTMSITWVDHPY